jgi:hypothetical protein
MVIGTLWLAFPLLAQQPSPAPADTSSQGQSKAGGQNAAPADTSSQGQSKAAEKGADNKDPAIQEQKTSIKDDRLFWLVPNYLTVENANQIPPLTTGQKFKLVALGAFDPFEYPYVGIIAGINQAENSDPSYGWGFKGYAKRYGSAFADTTIENFMVGAVLPSLLHQDPRFYQLGKGTFFHRFGYTALRIVFTRTDSGKIQFNYSEVAGSAIAAAISDTYHSPQERTVRNSVNTWWEQVAGDLLSYEVKEFWPDIHRKLHRKHVAQP